MADKVYPSSKPTTKTAATTPQFPANKAQLYNATRPAYRPRPPPRRRGCCCCFCITVTFIVILLLILGTITGGVIWVLYRPERPSFSVSSLAISQLNLTSSNQLNSKLNLSVTAANPNSKITFFYDPIAVKVASYGVDIGDGSFASFALGTKSSSVLRSSLSVSGETVDGGSKLKANLKNKSALPLKIEMDTKVKVKMGKVKSPKIVIRVNCVGVNAAVPSGKAAAVATTTGKAKCKVDVRFKIWKWTV